MRLACCVPNPNDGTSFHRALGPLCAMQREDRGLELSLPRPVPEGWELTWHWLAPCDALFVQRPFLPVHVELCRLAKSMGLPIWVDWDDDLTRVPRSNPSHKFYADAEAARENIWEIGALADMVTVSTEELARALAGAGRQPRVIPNACHHQFYQAQRQRWVSWRGSNSHDEDLATVQGQLAELARLPQFGQWRWLFMGDSPWEVEQIIPASRLELHGGAGLTSFVGEIARFAPFVHIVPLKNHHFNRCKSNLAWIEASCAGAITVAPDWEEWQRPGVVTYRERTDFAATVREVMNEFVDGQESEPARVRESRDYIREHLMLAQVNKLRWELVTELWRKRP